MGNSNSIINNSNSIINNSNNYIINKLNIKKNCVLCDYSGDGNDALLEMYSKYNIYNNHFVCINCFYDVVDISLNNTTSCFDNNTKNKNNFKLVKCEWCKKSSKNREIFKIYWKGKFNNHYMCYLCLHSKEHRRNINI